MDSVLDCEFKRRFGVEVELNTLDGAIRRLDDKKRDIPNGADYVANIIRKTLRKTSRIYGWHSTHNNNDWIVKPDSSCGIEVCSPILKGWSGLYDLIKLVQAFRQSKVRADSRCSFHVHVNIGDLNERQLGSVLAWYIKCEPVFMDAMAKHRRMSRYCQMIGMTDLFWDSFPLSISTILGRVSAVKYYSVNTYHFLKGGGFDALSRKPTIEFRAAEHDACLDPMYVKNWVRLLLHFIEVTKDRPMPKDYKQGDPWTGLLWLDPKDAFRVMRFDEPLSDGLNQVKQWFLARLFDQGFDSGATGLWSKECRKFAREEVLSMVSDSPLQREILACSDEMLFSKKYAK